MDRRSFFLMSGGAMLYAAPADTITLGVIGAGGRGTLVMTTSQKSPGVRVGGHTKRLNSARAHSRWPPGMGS